MPFTSFPPGLAVQSNLNSPELCHTPAVNGADFDMNALLKRYQQTVRYDNEKSNFIAELMLRVEYLTQDNDALKLEKQQNHELVTTFQTQKANYEKYIKNMQRALSENPFIMLLIDGDGMIFKDELVREGEEGGCKAAALLQKAVQEYVETELLDVPVASQIACRVYANVRGLGDVLVRTGVIEELSVFEDFVRGFTRGKALFDFIDVGFGKDRADKKIIELLKLFSQDFHCRRILFGCSHDNGYARALEENVQSEDLVKKVVLLEGVPFEKELVALPYRTKKFNGLFRETKIVSTSLRYSHAIPSPLDTPTGAVNFRAYNAYAGMPSRFPPPRTSLLDSPLPAAAAIAAAQLPRTPSSSTLASDGIVAAAKPALNNWAAKAAAPPPPMTEVPAYKRVTRDDVIARNRSGQRIDPPCKDYDKAEVDRIKKMKLCNVHFLRQECPYDNGCTHIHAFKPTKEEISTLRLVARMAPCVYGSGCGDIKCIYGHRCPAPSARTGVKGTKSCIFGKSCKFAPELHDIDTSVVKTLVVR